MKNFLAFTLVLFFQYTSLSAHEGMWFPMILNISDMQANGMRLTQEDIFSIRQSSLKDAIVLFGGGCTAEVISNTGLILTNHHCGFGAIQSHSTVENNYLRDGFWSANREEELACKGITATFIEDFVDVTERVLKGVTEEMSIEERNALVAARSKEIIAENTINSNTKAQVKSFYYGNQYFLITTLEYTDVRLVGAPPSSIGKFGGDTDNWVWPRHTGDFSLFRIYAAPDNSPADYAAENIPMIPKKSLSISTKGVQEGDFTMVYGFPAVTTQYLISDAVDYIVNKSNPAKIEMREASLAIIDAAMMQNDAMRIKYASKQSNISNGYKKWIGENMGLIRFDAVSKKRVLEEEFTAAAVRKGMQNYEQVLPKLRELQQQIEPYESARTFFIEYIFYGPEMLAYSRNYKAVLENYDALEEKDELQKKLEALQNGTEGHFKDFDLETDKKLFIELLQLYLLNTDVKLHPLYLTEQLSKYKGDVAALGNDLYAKSKFTNAADLKAILSSGSEKKIKKLSSDPAYLLVESFYNSYIEQIKPYYDALHAEVDQWMGVYVKGQMELMPNKSYWADANSTLRVSYGKVEGCIPNDGIVYTYQTTIEGIAQKAIPGDVDFDVPSRLIELYKNKDFGNYGINGTLPVAFLASNHTTGGNSGSPVLNADGHLIGLNFDRSWQSTMSDVMFNPEICRNIAVDIRYVLFVIDKYAGAGHLIKEMNLVY